MWLSPYKTTETLRELCKRMLFNASSVENIRGEQVRIVFLEDAENALNSCIGDEEGDLEYVLKYAKAMERINGND